MRRARIKVHPKQRRLPGYRWPVPLTGCRPYAFADLQASAGYRLEFLADHLRISWARIDEYRRAGLTADEADQFAGRVGMHPAEIWTHWT